MKAKTRLQKVKIDSVNPSPEIPPKKEFIQHQSPGTLQTPHEPGTIKVPATYHSTPPLPRKNAPTLHLPIRRRIKQKHRLRILVRQHRAQRSLGQLAEPFVIGALAEHIRAEIPVGPSLVDGVPLLLPLEVGAAKVVTMAAGDEVEIRGPVWAQSALVRGPVEAAGRFGAAGGFEFCDAFQERGVLVSAMEEPCDLAGRDAARFGKEEELTVVEQDLLQLRQCALVGGSCFDAVIVAVAIDIDIGIRVGLDGSSLDEIVQRSEACKLGKGAEFYVFRILVIDRAARDDG